MIGFTNKVATDEEFFTFDYVEDLASGETIVSALWAIAVVTGTDPAASSMLFGASSISGSKVTQMVINGLNNVRYLLTCQATTSNGQKITKYGSFLVSLPSA